MLCRFRALVLNIPLETREPEPNAKVAIWYSGKEPNMKKAAEKITRAYPNAEDHPFDGLGRGEIMAHPEWIAEEILRFGAWRRSPTNADLNPCFMSMARILRSRSPCWIS